MEWTTSSDLINHTKYDTLNTHFINYAKYDI